MRKKHKCISISPETERDLKTLQTLLGVNSDSEVLRKLVSDEIRRQSGEDVIAVESNTSSETTESLLSVADEAQEKLDESAVSMLKQLIKISRSIEERNYVLYDAFNNYMRFLGEDLPPYKSCDVDLSFANRDNRSDYFEKAHCNFKLRIKNAQQKKSDMI